MRHLYLSEVKEFINNCGIPKEQLKQFRIATSKADDAIPDDMKHTLVALEKSKYVHMYISRYMGKSAIGIRLYPKDTYVIHNDCPPEEVFAGCSEMNNVDGLWFWKYLADDDNNSDGNHHYHECPKEFLEKVLEPTAATVKDITEQKMSPGTTSGKTKRGKEAKTKETAKIKKTTRQPKKANIVDITLDEIKKSQKKDAAKYDQNISARPILKLNYDESKYPTELVERYIEFYGLNPVELEEEHGIKAVIKTMYDNQGSKESMETAVGLYNLLAAHSAITNNYNQLVNRYNDCKTAYDLVNQGHEMVSKNFSQMFNKYCSYVAYYRKKRHNIIGKLGFDTYEVQIVKNEDAPKTHKRPVKQYTVYDKKHLTIGSILNDTGLYVSSVIEQ